MNTVTERPVSLTEGAPMGLAVFETLTARYEFALRMAARGSNYFVGYIDAQGPYGLSYGFAAWVKPNQVHMQDLHGLIH